jgi:DNA adenine methylase
MKLRCDYCFEDGRGCGLEKGHRLHHIPTDEVSHIEAHLKSKMVVKPRPFLKWVGGKTQLLPELLKRVPKSWNPNTDLYCELFLGAGALFWELQPKRAVLNDANNELYITWLALEHCFENDMYAALRWLQHNYPKKPEACYYHWRSLRLPEHAIGARAARTIFLNKAGFNGLYRVNKSGQFNVPWGQNPNTNVFDEENLRACAVFLQSIDVRLRDSDFADCLVTEDVNLRGALIYLDPPYIPVSKTSNFTSYTTEGFTYVDQLRLVQYAVWLRDQGAHVILSNAADEVLIENYRRCGFTCDLVSARRSINSKASKRGPIGEYIITGG